MKYEKPRHSGTGYSTIQYSAIFEFLDSLPAEFEVVDPGMTQVKWPSELTKERLKFLALYSRDWSDLTNAFTLLAAIAPEEKKPTKRRVYILQFQGPGENHGKLELSFNPKPQFQWVKVGECEVTE